MRSLVLALAVAFLAATNGFAAEPINLDEPTLGVVFVPIPPEDLESSAGVSIPWPTRKAVFAAYVEDTGPAWNAGLEAHDIVTHINGKATPDIPATIAALKSLTTGKDATILARRPIAVDGRIRWKSGKLKATPITRRQLAERSIVEEPTAKRDGTIFRYHGNDLALPAKSELQLYLIQKDGQLNPVLQITYVAEEWLFAENLTFVIAGERIELAKGHFDWNRDNTHNQIWEWTTIPIGPGTTEAKIALAMSAATLERVFLDGQTYVAEIASDAYSAGETMRVLDYFQSLTGEPLK